MIDSNFHPKRFIFPNLLGLILSILIPFGTIYFVRSSVGVEGLAKWQFLVSLSAIGTFLDLGAISSLNNAAFFLSRNDDSRSSSLKTEAVWFISKRIIFAGALLSSLLFVFPIGSETFTLMDLSLSLISLSFLYISTGTLPAYVEGVLRQQGRIAQGLFFLSIMRLFDFILLVVASLLTKDIAIWFMSLLLARVLIFLFLRTLIRRSMSVPRITNFESFLREYRGYIRNSGGVVVISLSSYVGSNLVVAVLALKMEPSQFSQLIVIRLIVGSLTQLSRILSNSFYPALVHELSLKAEKKVNSYLRKNIKYNLLVNVVFAPILWLIFPTISHLLIGQSGVRSLELIIFLFLGIVTSLWLPLHQLVFAANKSLNFSVSTLITYLMLLSVLYVPTFQFSLLDIAYLFLIAECLILISGFVFASRIILDWPRNYEA